MGKPIPFSDKRCEQSFELAGLRDIIEDLEVGESILFRDGKIKLEIIEINCEDATIKCQCIKSSTDLRKGGSCVFPNSKIEYKELVDEDLLILEKYAKNGLIPDYLCISFATNVDMIQHVREV